MITKEYNKDNMWKEVSRKKKENRYEEILKVTQVKNLDEEKVMTNYNKEIEFEKVQKTMEENIEESKLQEPITEEKNSLRKDINKMTHKDRILIVNKILENVGTKTLFVYEEPNYYVEKVAQELLEDWIKNDY